MSRFFLPNENTPTIGTCVDPCPHPYYGNEVTGLCTLCDLPNCLNCTASDSCNECASPYFLWLGVCVELCPEVMYGNYENATCENCG
jgi:hypothetical protein